MLLIPIGSAGRQLTFNATETHDCANCGEPREFNLRLRYEWGSLLYLPICVTDREYQLVCPACQHGWLINRRSGEAMLGGDPIPWKHRNGWMILTAIVLVTGVAFARSRGLI